MAVPEGSMARGEVQITPFGIVAGTTAKFDLTPGAYDLHVIKSSPSTEQNMKVELYTDPEQTAVVVMYMQTTAETAATSVLVVAPTTPQNVLVVPRGGGYIPFTIPYGIRIRFLGAGTYNGFLVSRRR
jgi:hypothetical protein